MAENIHPNACRVKGKRRTRGITSTALFFKIEFRSYFSECLFFHYTFRQFFQRAAAGPLPDELRR